MVHSDGTLSLHTRSLKYGKVSQLLPTYACDSDIYSVVNASVVNAKCMVSPDQIYMVFWCTVCVCV